MTLVDDDDDSDLQRSADIQVATGRVTTALEALMQCAPGDEPVAAQDDLYPLREVIEDAIEMLSEREQYIFNAVVVERLSYRALAARLSLSKSQVHRIQLSNVNRLRTILAENVLVRQHLEGGS